MSQTGAPAAYRGYRLQALYTLKRLLAPGLGDSIVFQPEGLEDLDILDNSGGLREVVQVKSYSNLTLSDLSPDKEGSFFHRAIELLRLESSPVIKLVNFGQFSNEMIQAWAGSAVHSARLTEKLIEKGLLASDIEKLIDEVELVALDEEDERSEVFSQLGDLLTGVDPESAFDLLNFWLYQVSENREQLTHADLVSKIQGVGRFLSERHAYHSEWFTSIVPLETASFTDEQRKVLEEEFYAGVSARYEHILANLDFRRDNKLAEVAQAFSSNQVVIIHAASGQGKTTLAYRYLHETFPEKWRFSVRLIEGRQHALSIHRALAGFANALQMPLAVYIDVSPRDDAWPELVRDLSRHPYLQTLVTIREEDFRRAHISGAEFSFASIELDFDEVEARQIYERASKTKLDNADLDFEAAWDRFGGKGPLMEFVYLLTSTSTLQERLRGQVDRIRDEVRMGAHRDELKLLRLVAVVSAYEARLSTSRLVNNLDLPDLERTLSRFEKEYLIRLSVDRQWIEGVHPVRSWILSELLISPDTAPWLDVASESLALMLEDDLESFILHAFVERPEEYARTLKIVREFEPASWSGLAGILRTLSWAGVRDYVEANRSTIETAREEFGEAWWAILDLNFAGDEVPELGEWWTTLGDLIPAERQARFKELRESQTAKEQCFTFAAEWLAQLTREPLLPASPADWSGAAEVVYWSTRFGKDPRPEEWLLEQDFSAALEELALNVLGELSLALHMANRENHVKWLENKLPTLHRRLAQEYKIIALEEQASTLKIHFLPFATELDNEGSQSDSSGDSDTYKKLHDETLERIELMRHLLPFYDKYGSQGHGYKFGILDLPMDNTQKEGVAVRYLPPKWAVRLNGIARGLARNRYRPETWSQYVSQLLDTRKLFVSCMELLQSGLIKFLQRRNPINIIETYLDGLEWDQTRKLLRELPDVPRIAVDPWGFAHEKDSKTSILAESQQVHLPSAIALRKYTPLLSAQDKYFSAVRNFLEQSPHVMTTNFYVGKLAPQAPKREAMVELLHENGIKTDLAHLTTMNLSDVKQALPEYQRQFRALFGHLVDDVDLTDLEQREQELVFDTWPLWYFFAYEPGQIRQRSQVRNAVRLLKLKLKKRFLDAASAMNSDEAWVSVMDIGAMWEDTSTLWLRLDVNDPPKLYEIFENLVSILRSTVGPIDYHSLAHYLVEEDYKYSVVVPVIRGRMISDLVWPLQTSITVLSTKPLDESLWLYVQQPIPQDVREALGLELWSLSDIELANQFSAALATATIFASQISEFNEIPDETEVGHEIPQTAVEQKARLLSEALQLAFDSIAMMDDKTSKLSDKELEERADLLEAVAGLKEIRDLVAPFVGSEDKSVLTLEETVELAGRLRQAQLLAEGVKLFWIADALERLDTS